MTGFGEAVRRTETVTVTVEVRTINSRYFKFNVRLPEGFAALEPRIEGAVRGRIKRGTVQVQVRVDRQSSSQDFAINGQVLDSYREQLNALTHDWISADPVHIDSLLLLPGVVQDTSRQRLDANEDWPLVEAVLLEAINGLATMRVDEGAAMAADLESQCHAIDRTLDEIESLAPGVVEAYRQRLLARLNTTLARLDVHSDAADLLREVSLFSERSDISEETVRLRSHLSQFREIMGYSTSSGRKLEFLTQEMFRETNTIGSKANDVEIARHVVEIKAAIERLREQVQNVE